MKSIAKVIAKQIAFNCVPQIDVFLDNGYTKEEMKMFWETQKIMEDTAHPCERDRGPRRRAGRALGSGAHRDEAQADRSRRRSELLSRAPGVVVIDERQPGGYPTPVTEGCGDRSGVRRSHSRGHQSRARSESVDCVR